MLGAGVLLAERVSKMSETQTHAEAWLKCRWLGHLQFLMQRSQVGPACVTNFCIMLLLLSGDHVVLP